MSLALSAAVAACIISLAVLIISLRAYFLARDARMIAVGHALDKMAHKPRAARLRAADQDPASSPAAPSSG